MTGVLTRRGEDTQRYTQGECRVTMEADIGVMRLQTKGHQGLL